MKNRKQWISILIVAMALATAWAIRGQFGHEQGAAWAGVIGGLALVMVAQRKEWYKKMLPVSLASGIGWGAGGMISYGMVVGYGRANNFVNALYGLEMLFVIGALFGLLGGGLVGLALDSTKNNRVKWGQLVAEMTAGGIISYFFLIEQIGLRMTPPRSEAWAVCFGAAMAMLWYMARNKRNSAMRVAIFAALGGGFGFGFGNFLQIAGNVLAIKFNMWNVMEYSIGFFGGAGMAYGVFSSKWPVENSAPTKWATRISAIIIAGFIPLIVFRESLTFKTFLNRLGEIPNPGSVATASTIFSVLVLIALLVIVLWKLKTKEPGRNDVTLLFFLFLTVYASISFLVSGLFAGKVPLNHLLYVVNIVAIFILTKKEFPAMFRKSTNEVNVTRWLIYFILIIVVLAIFAFISINIHGEMGGSHNRFTIS